MDNNSGAAPDPLGHELLAARVAAIPATLAGMLARPPGPLSARTLASTRFIVTGTGSSEAHARYLLGSGKAGEIAEIIKEKEKKVDDLISGFIQRKSEDRGSQKVGDERSPNQSKEKNFSQT